MIYKIPDILNKIEWDGVNSPRIYGMHCKRPLRQCTVKTAPHKHYYNLTDTEHRRVKVSIGRIIFMLRTGCTVRQLQEFKVQTRQDGSLRDWSKNARPYDFFKNMSDIKETVRIIDDLSRGDSSSFHALFVRERGFLRYTMLKMYGLSKARFDEMFDEALENTEARLREFRIRSLRKIHWYFITEMVNLFKGPKARRHAPLPRNLVESNFT